MKNTDVAIVTGASRGIGRTIDVVAPGPTATELFFEGKSQELIDTLAKRAPLERLGTDAARTVHVGDDPVTDVAGARAAGLSAILLDRSGRAPDSIAGLAELHLRPELAA